MNDSVIQLETNQIARVLDCVGHPSFLLDVDGPGKFRFAHINTQQMPESKLDDDGLIGQRPHDVFPKRVADTLVANYERCRASGQVCTYDEELALSAKSNWWRTTLSPVVAHKDGGEVQRIIGTAVDITAAKLHELELTKALSAQTASSEGVRSFAANSMLDTEGPMRAILTWLDILRDGFVDLGDGKLQEMDRVQQLAIDAVVGMDAVLHSDGFACFGPRDAVPIDLAHMCRDIVALVDPTGRLKISLPDQGIEAEWAITQIVLRCLLEQSCKRAIGNVSVKVEAAGASNIALVIQDDSTFEPRLKDRMSEVSSAAKIVKERGGDLSMTSSEDEGACVRVTLPGTICSKELDAPLQRTG